MIAQDEIDAFNEWKARKLQGSIDLSMEAYNAEMESQAVAWEEGFEACNSREGGFHEPNEGENPYRRPGMNGEKPYEPIEIPRDEPVSETQLPAGLGPGETDPVEDARRAFGFPSTSTDPQ